MIFSTTETRAKVIQFFWSPSEYKSWYTYKKLHVAEQRQDTSTQADIVVDLSANITAATIGIKSQDGQLASHFFAFDVFCTLAHNMTVLGETSNYEEQH